MRLTYLLIFLLGTAHAQNNRRIHVVPDPQSPEDFDHQFKGCPENSECDQVMGHMLERWKVLVKNLKTVTPTKKAQALEAYRAKYGLPVEFYTNERSLAGFKPVLHDSHCKLHNPKAPLPKTVKGTAFLKSLSPQTAVIWRDQEQIELPLKDNLLPQPVKVYFENGPVNFLLPIADQPLFIKGRELYVLKEFDELYYMLKISASGEWKVVDVDFSVLSKWEDKRENVDCPVDSVKADPAFNEAFCKTVWDEDLRKTVTVKMHQGCSTSG